MRDFNDDPVRQAMDRWRQRFPDIDAAMHTDPYTVRAVKMLEDALVRADIAMQDEGFGFEQRRRIVTAALYGSVDIEKAMRDLAARQEQIEYLKSENFSHSLIPRSPDGEER